MSKRKDTGNFRDNLIARGEEARTVRKVVAIVIISIITILVIGGISGYIYVKSALEPVDPSNEKGIEIEIPLGSSTSGIAEVLEENDIIKNSMIFRFYIKFKNESGFQAGNYTFTQSMTFDEIIESLKSGTIIKEPVYRVTIPEGLTMEEIAAIYASKLPITEEEFLDKVDDLEYINQLIAAYPILTEDILNPELRHPLEGYLFAATYDFYEEDPPVETIIENMLDKSQSVIGPYLNLITERELSIHEAMTFASVVEKEAVTQDQRKKISGIFYNRIEAGMRLQTDPTVLYAIGGHKEKVLLSDTEVESPFNTYYIDGLPIGPISNFSEAALEAAINPEESEYYYFLHDGQGNIYYSTTLEEHNAYKAEYIQ
ncbi:endolytic transglycosylase MltG [Ornithinibacillus contaminans]|uniref:endolytic transglycosylase MltG n=1 Tax=Ornithinibacillus contaminans TaxID=694055 RepID=UPI00064DB9C5|nr:endolytic transglycosylase MltG [Ornithinibacillus contaminans]